MGVLRICSKIFQWGGGQGRGDHQPLSADVALEVGKAETGRRRGGCGIHATREQSLAEAEWCFTEAYARNSDVVILIL